MEAGLVLVPPEPGLYRGGRLAEVVFGELCGILQASGPRAAGTVTACQVRETLTARPAQPGPGQCERALLGTTWAVQQQGVMWFWFTRPLSRTR